MGQHLLQKIVVVTRQTRLSALRAKYNTTAQAKFLVGRARMMDAVRSGKSDATIQSAASEGEALFDNIEQENTRYEEAVRFIRQEVQDLLPVHIIDRQQVPQFLFGGDDIVVTVGQDGLVANTAKYAVGLPIIAVNPDPSAIDGILLPFEVPQVRSAVQRVLSGRAEIKLVTLAEAVLADGQKLLAFNDLFIGARTHVSARYRLEFGRSSEIQSSSGLLVSTGAGSTGWFSSMCNMAGGVRRFLKKGSAEQIDPIRMPWDDKRLAFVVREPFISKTSSAKIIADLVPPGSELIIESRMEQNGVIFSDGIEADFLEFNSGSVARIRASQSQATLVSP